MEPSSSGSKEKAFSIAAALPVPFYGSMMDDLSNVCLQSEERLPFSQNEHSVQHVAQQLTLLQQVYTHTHTHKVHSPAFHSRCCCRFLPLEGDIPLWIHCKAQILSVQCLSSLMLYLLWHRKCSKDAIQFISSTPEHKESGTNCRTSEWDVYAALQFFFLQMGDTSK